MFCASPKKLFKVISLWVTCSLNETLITHLTFTSSVSGIKCNMQRRTLILLHMANEVEHTWFYCYTHGADSHLFFYHWFPNGDFYMYSRKYQKKSVGKYTLLATDNWKFCLDSNYEVSNAWCNMILYKRGSQKRWELICAFLTLLNDLPYILKLLV